MSALYQVKITSNKSPSVIGTLPTDFSMEASSEWTSPFDSGIFDKFSKLAGAFSFSLKDKRLSSQVWSGSSPIQLTIPIEFMAQTDAKKEVVDPIKNLMKLALPGTTGVGGRGEFLDPPGPTVFDQFKTGSTSFNGEKITITVGKFLRFSKIVVVSVQPTFTLRLDSRGFPMRGRADVTFRTFTVLSKGDLNRMFLG